MWVDDHARQQLLRNKAYVEWAESVMGILKNAGLTTKVIQKASQYAYGWFVPPEQFVIEVIDADGFTSRHILAMFQPASQSAEAVAFFHRYQKATFQPPEE